MSNSTAHQTRRRERANLKAKLGRVLRNGNTNSPLYSMAYNLTNPRTEIDGRGFFGRIGGIFTDLWETIRSYVSRPFTQRRWRDQMIQRVAADIKRQGKVSDRVFLKTRDGKGEAQMHAPHLR